MIECLCFSVFSLCHCLLRFLCASAICNLFGVLSSLWMWKPGADRLRGNQSNKQEEARLPDNVFEQTPRICFGVFGTLEIFQRRSEQQAGGSSPATDNKFEQTTRILGFLGTFGIFQRR